VINLISGIPGAGMTYRALCQDCLHIEHYQSAEAQAVAHTNLSTCPRAGCSGDMCMCDGCLAIADEALRTPPEPTA